MAGQETNLVLTGRDKKALAAVKSEVEKKNSRAAILTGDLNEPDLPEKIIRFTIDTYGKLDILINNAGITLDKPLEETRPEEWDRLMAVNARAPYFLCQHAIQYLKQSDTPVIINISSVVGHKGYVNQSAYGASKHALTGFTKTLAKEVHPYGIRVHLIAPGGVNTGLVTQVRPDLSEQELIDPKEIADIVNFLIYNRGNAVIDEINVARASNLPWK